LLRYFVIVQRYIMHLQNIGPFIFVGFFLFVFGLFIYKIFKNGGLKGAMFGAPIERTVGEVVATSPSRIMSIAVKVHVLGGASLDKAIGLEFVAKSVASYQMMPVSLSKADARKLIALLESATTGK